MATKTAKAQEPQEPKPDPNIRDREVFKSELEGGMPSTLPLHSYITRSVEEHRGAFNEDEYPWHSKLWYFVRLLKAHPDLASLRPKKVTATVEALMKNWTSSKKGNDWTKSDWEYWMFVSTEDARAEILDGWDKVRYLPGFQPLNNAMTLSIRTPLQLSEDVKERRTDGYRAFISLAGWLQISMGNKPILLPVVEVGAMLHVEPMTISRYRTWAQEDQFLKLVKEPTFLGKGKAGKATEFMFDVTRFPILRERAQQGTIAGFVVALDKAEWMRKRAENLRRQEPTQSPPRD